MKTDKITVTNLFEKQRRYVVPIFQRGQAEAAEIMGVTQPDVSRMLKGQFRDLSVEPIMRMLVKLGCAVDIVVRPKGKKPRFAPIHLEELIAGRHT